MRPEEIKKHIEQHIPDTTAIVSGADGVHFEAIVISPAFTGKTRVQKQQLVYAALNQYITDGTLHAISIKTHTPEEWDRIKENPTPEQKG
jgi:acid stress-induced BolA-like protein IbaG/YrbA